MIRKQNQENQHEQVVIIYIFFLSSKFILGWNGGIFFFTTKQF